jgi:hypothetical protein
MYSGKDGFIMLLIVKGALLFAGGVATALAAKKIIKNQTVRELTVKGVAHGMQLRDKAQEVIQNVKEEAVDICHEAKTLNKKAKDETDGEA